MPNLSRGTNRVLAALPEDEWQLVGDDFQSVSLPLDTRLYEPGDVLDKIYFPTSGVISSVTIMANGATIEGLVTGREGLIGGAGVVQPATTPWQILTQSPLEAQVIAADTLRRAIGSMPELQSLLLLHSQAMQYLATQSIACNRFHRLPARAARWLLIVRDRIDSDEIEITQEFLANMLGAQRPSVTVALGILERSGFITRERGRITIQSRAALEAAACECYSRVETEIARMFAAE